MDSSDKQVVLYLPLKVESAKSSDTKKSSRLVSMPMSCLPVAVRSSC